MNDRPYNSPFTYYAIARRQQMPLGVYYEPFSSPDKVMEPPPGAHYQFFDAQRNPCEFGDRAIYAVYDAQLVPPPHFALLDAGISPRGEPIVSPEYPCMEDAMAAWTNPWIHGGSAPPNPPEMLPSPPETVTRNTINARLVGIPAAPEQEVDAEDLDTAAQYQIIKGADGYHLKPPKSGKTMRVTNYILTLQEIRHCISLDQGDVEDRMTIQLEVSLFGPIRTVPLPIEYEKLDSVLDIIRKKVGEGIIYHHARIFEERLEVLLRSELPACPHVYEYKTCGWTKLPDGQHTYVHDGGVPPAPNVVFKCGFAFGKGPAVRSGREIVCGAFDILNMAKSQDKIIIPFLWAHLGLMWSLFAEAGYPPHAILFISGVSGSLKTAVTKMLFNFSGDPGNAVPASFRDTSASMEISLGRYRDRVLLVDDYCPAANQESRKAINQTLENLVRFYGDGNAKGRADPRMDTVHMKKAQGMCVVTGEDIAGSQSSQLRCLFLSVNRTTYDGAVLQRYQEAPHLWTEYLRTFVDSLFAIEPDVVGRIRTEFPVCRRMAETHLRERRLVDTCCWLTLTARIALETASKLADMDLVSEYQETFKQAILQTCVESEQRARQQTPAHIFAETLLVLLQRQDVILGTEQEFKECPHDYLGVLQDGFWYLWPQETYCEVCRYYAAGGKNFPLSAPALWTALANAGVLIRSPARKNGKIVYENGTKMPFGSRPRLLKIVPEKIYELAEGE